MTTHDDDETFRSSVPEFDAPAALGRFRERIQRERSVPRASWRSALAARLSLAGGAFMRPAIAAVSVLVLAFAATATGVAETILTVFEPKQVATIRVDPRQLGTIPDPTAYGTLTWIAKPAWREATDASAAAAGAGFSPLVPSSLPAGLPTQARFGVMPEAKATFQFDEAKARAAAARVSATIPPMPAAIAATTLTMTGGPAVMQQYGGSGGRVSEPAGITSPGTNVVIVQAKAPVVTSNGATVNELRDYALAQPGIPPSVAAQVRAIGDPVRTMLIPVGVDPSDAKPVSVRGTQGYLFGDNTGLGSGIVWLERGYVFGVLGSLKEADLIALVNGLR
ncbi:MAG: hypothetical protein HYU87_02350 [Chloroflexi bacterium]|nr:hypothetical protein [Chloroflexota bacterium]